MKPAKDNSSRNNNSEKSGNDNRSSQTGQAKSGGDSNFSGKKDGKRDFRGNRRWRKNRYRDRNKNEESSADSAKQLRRNKITYTCEICGSEIKDISSAIASGNQNPVHFDCMLEKLKKENRLENSEKIVYLGSGNFGIIKQEKNRPMKEFKIVRKIEVENRDEKPEWRIDQLKVK